MHSRLSPAFLLASSSFRSFPLRQTLALCTLAAGVLAGLCGTVSAGLFLCPVSALVSQPNSSACRFCFRWGLSTCMVDVLAPLCLSLPTPPLWSNSFVSLPLHAPPVAVETRTSWSRPPVSHLPERLEEASGRLSVVVRLVELKQRHYSTQTRGFHQGEVDLSPFPRVSCRLRNLLGLY